MRQIQRIILLAAAAAAAMSALPAQAQFNYTTGDLLISFREVNGTTPGPQDVSVNLGNIDSFLATMGPGYNFLGDNNAGALLGTDLAGRYGNLDSVFMSASATYATIPAGYDMWTTRTRDLAQSDTAVPGSTAWTRKPAFNQSAASQKVEGVGNGAENSGTDISNNATVTVDSSASSYHAFVKGGPTSGEGTYGGYFTPAPGVETSTGTSFDGSDVVRLDLYELLNTASGFAPGDYKGFFEFQADGDLYFVTPVPEPGTYGMLAGLGLLGLAFRRGLRKAVA